MIKFSFPNIIKTLALSGAAIVLPACEGIFSGVYDEPVDDKSQISSGQLYIDASDWLEWHYMDLHAISADGVAVDNPSDLWETYRIPTATAPTANSGIIPRRCLRKNRRSGA